MIYELRQYDIHPDRWEAYCKWSLQRAFPLFFDHFKLPVVGFREAMPVEDTPYDTFNTTIGVHWLLAWESVEALAAGHRQRPAWWRTLSRKRMGDRREGSPPRLPGTGR